MSTPTRSCGSCSVCCVVLGVGAWKPAGTACEHIRPEGGCAQYEKRPQECRPFTCLWLDGWFREGDRPDQIGVMLNGSFTGLPQYDAGQLVVHETKPGAVKLPAVRAFLSRLAQERLLVFVDGKRAAVMGGPAKVLKRIAKRKERG